jgi:hypothetical protein
MSRTPLEAAELKEYNRNELSRGWEEIFETERLGPLPAFGHPPPREGRWRAIITISPRLYSDARGNTKVHFASRTPYPPSNPGVPFVAAIGPVAAVSFADLGEVGDQFDAADVFCHFVAELAFDADA